MDKNSLELNFDGVPTKISDDDKNAIEEAVRLKESNGGAVTAITLGEPDAKKSLREAIAMGCDKACLIHDSAFAELDAVGTANVLASAIRKLGNFDMILCATATTDLSTGLIGPCLSEILNLPLLSYVKSLQVNDGKINADRELENVTERLEARTPAVVTVTRSINEPRLPSVLQIMAASKGPLIEFNAKDLGYDAGDYGKIQAALQFSEVKAPRTARSKQLLEGDPKEVASMIIGILQREGAVS